MVGSVSHWCNTDAGVSQWTTDNRCSGTRHGKRALCSGHASGHATVHDELGRGSSPGFGDSCRHGYRHAGLQSHGRSLSSYPTAACGWTHGRREFPPDQVPRILGRQGQAALPALEREGPRDDTAVVVAFPAVLATEHIDSEAQVGREALLGRGGRKSPSTSRRRTRRDHDPGTRRVRIDFESRACSVCPIPGIRVAEGSRGILLWWRS